MLIVVRSVSPFTLGWDLIFSDWPNGTSLSLDYTDTLLHSPLFTSFPYCYIFSVFLSSRAAGESCSRKQLSILTFFVVH